MFNELPLELMMRIFRFVDSATMMNLTLDDLKRGKFFSFLFSEEKFWNKILMKEFGPYAKEFDLPLNILVDEQVVEQYENNAFFRYLLLSKCQGRLRKETFLLSSYQGKYHLLSGNLERDKFLTFQSQIPFQNCRLFSWEEQPSLKGKIFLQGNFSSNYFLTIQGMMPMSKGGITIQINWKYKPEVLWRYDSKTITEKNSFEFIGGIHFTFISKTRGPKFPIYVSCPHNQSSDHEPTVLHSTFETLNREEYICEFFENQTCYEDVDDYAKRNSPFLIGMFLDMVRSIT